MDGKIKNMLEEEIKSQIEDLADLTPGSKEKSAAIDDLTKLYKLKVEENRAEWDSQEKYDESSLKRNQLDEQVKDRYFRIGIEAAGIVLPLIFYAAWMRKGFKFEESGTFTSTTFKGLFNRFKPAK